MKKFEDSEFFGGGSDIVAVYPFDYKKEFSEVIEHAYETSEKYKQMDLASNFLSRDVLLRENENTL